MVALYPVVKQSFNMYYDITDVLSVFIDRLQELEISDCVRVYEFLRRIRKQFDELDNFYDYCKSIGLARTSEYPEVERISQRRLDIMDNFIRERSGTKQVESEEEEEEVWLLDLESPDMDMITGPGEGKKEVKMSRDDLLNLGDGGQTVEEYADKIGLAFFDSGPTNQPPALAGGLSPADLDEMYQQRRQNSGNVATGSAR